MPLLSLSNLAAYLEALPKPIACIAPTDAPYPAMFVWPGTTMREWHKLEVPALTSLSGSLSGEDRTSPGVILTAAGQEMEVTLDAFVEWQSTYLLPMVDWRADQSHAGAPTARTRWLVTFNRAADIEKGGSIELTLL
jgi:hypothetical protein